jgi:hypothetical protein
VCLRLYPKIRNCTIFLFIFFFFLRVTESHVNKPLTEREWKFQLLCNLARYRFVLALHSHVQSGMDVCNTWHTDLYSKNNTKSRNFPLLSSSLTHSLPSFTNRRERILLSLIYFYFSPLLSLSSSLLLFSFHPRSASFLS